VGYSEGVDRGKKFTRVPQRDAGGKGEHVDKKQDRGRRPTRRGKASYRSCLSDE
jgi:hypothetical protein